MSIKIVIKNFLKRFLPRDFQEFLRLKLNKYSTISYSQEGEDMILARLFETKQNGGFYVDVGAHHPIRFSNTYLFYKKGWRGINIDAMPGSMKLFNKLRPRDINIEKAISDKKQVLTYYVFNEPALSGFSKELSEKRDKMSNYFILKTIEIETTTLEKVLDEYLPAGQEIDFLSIDVEGLDFEVLKSINLNKYKPKVILIEILEVSLEDIINHEITLFLKQFGYRVYAKTMNTVFFIEDKFYENMIKGK